MELIGSVPNYDLYGSPHDWDLPGLLHCETITARSALHDWQIAAHRHEYLHQLMHVKSGTFEAVIDGTTLRLNAPVILYISPLTVHSFQFSPQIKGEILSLYDAALPDSLRKDIALLSQDLPFVVLEGDRKDAAIKTIATCFEELLVEFKGDRPARGSAIKGYLTLLITHFLRQAGRGRPVGNELKGQNEKLVLAFKTLVNREYVHHHPITFYTKALGVSEARLGAACKQVLDRTPKAVCHQRVIVEARRALHYGALSIAEIGFALGFNDPAYFSRFFKLQTGQSPAECRASEPAYPEGSI